MGKTIEAFHKLYEEHIGELVYMLRKVPAIAETLREMTAKDLPQFEVHLSTDIAGRLKEGSAYLAKRQEDGLLTAVVFDTKTKKIIKQVGLSEISPKLVSPELLSSLDQAVIYSALSDMSRRLEVVDRKLDAVLQGQRDDRLGLVDSAEDLYYLAALAQDRENRRQLLISAISQSSEGRGRLIREVEYYLQEIDKLPTDTGQILISSLTRDVSKDASVESCKVVPVAP
jgi:hypothetical protein